ncbi:hypothetical protein [Streptomyces lucensis]|uniref:hypothetical protein n=1 Tax=Streptomyces lucensis TaxID=67319 RepID=UPI00167BCE1C|nr:hypothetical protein [Streptomyces lucensis]
MGTEIVQVVEQAGPYLTAAVGAYGAAVLARAENAAADATADVGCRLLRAVWRRGDARHRAALETAVAEAAAEPGDADAAGALRQQIKRVLREDPELLSELAALLRTAGAVTVNVSGTRAIGARSIGIAVSGDHNTIRPPRS